MYKKQRKHLTSIPFNCICHWVMKIENHNPAPFCCTAAPPNLFGRNYLVWVINYLLMRVRPAQSTQFILTGNMEAFGEAPAIMVKIMVSAGNITSSFMPLVSSTRLKKLETLNSYFNTQNLI